MYVKSIEVILFLFLRNEIDKFMEKNSFPENVSKNRDTSLSPEHLRLCESTILELPAVLFGEAKYLPRKEC